MGKYSNVGRVPGESRIAGIKYRIYYIAVSAITTCPSLAEEKVADDDYKIMTGDFTLADGEEWNYLDVVSTTGELKWESMGSKGNLKSKLTATFFVNTLSSPFYRFIEEGKNDELIMVIERADCTGVKYMFGGCCLPAQMTKYEGGTGKKPEDDLGTTIEFEAYANGLPPVLPDDITITVAA